jgi:ribose 1,5-bisphosphokinase PhnN
MCVPALPLVIGAGASALLGAGATAYSASKSAKVQKQAINANAQAAADQAQRSEQQFNRLNQKQPGIAAMWANNRSTAGRGLGSTFLTGAAGVPQGGLPLGGGSLLGG